MYGSFDFKSRLLWSHVITFTGVRLYTKISFLIYLSQKARFKTKYKLSEEHRKVTVAASLHRHDAKKFLVTDFAVIVQVSLFHHFRDFLVSKSLTKIQHHSSDFRRREESITVLIEQFECLKGENLVRNVSIYSCHGSAAENVILLQLDLRQNWKEHSDNITQLLQCSRQICRYFLKWMFEQILELYLFYLLCIGIFHHFHHHYQKLFEFNCSTPVCVDFFDHFLLIKSKNIRMKII